MKGTGQARNGAPANPASGTDGASQATASRARGSRDAPVISQHDDSPKHVEESSSSESQGD